MVRWLVLGGLLLPGCTNPRAEEARATRTDSSGVEIVTATATDRPLGWTFEPVITIGGADRAADAFYQVPAHGLAFDREGRIHILDAGNRRVLIFDRNGELVRAVGGPGDGPGEFRFPASLHLDASGTMTVHDFGHRSLLRFDSSGVFIDQQPAVARTFGPVRADDRARLFATRGPMADSDGVFFQLYRATPDDTTQLSTVRLPDARSIEYESCGVSISLPPVFADPPKWSSRGSRIALVQGPEYSVKLIENGDEVRHLRRPLEPLRANAEHAARELGEGEEWVIGRRPCTVPPQEVIEQRGIAETVPLIGGVVVTTDGSVWVQRKVVGQSAGPVDVFDAGGEYSGTLPADTPWPVDFDEGDRMLVLEEDDLGVQRVVVYRLLRG